MLCHLSFSSSTSSNFAATSPTLGLSESLILGAGFSDIELDFANVLEGWLGAEEGGRDGLDNELVRTLESVSSLGLKSLELVTMAATAIQ